MRFDHDNYRTKHLPLIKSRMGAALKHYAIDKGLADGAGAAPSAYIAMCHLLCDSMEVQSSLSPHAQEIGGDIRNFTDVMPIVQISEVVVENSAECASDGAKLVLIQVRSGDPMKRWLAVLSTFSVPAQAHDSLVPHTHPHGFSILPGLDAVVIALLALAAAFIAYWKLVRAP